MRELIPSRRIVTARIERIFVRQLMVMLGFNAPAIVSGTEIDQNRIQELLLNDEAVFTTVELDEVCSVFGVPLSVVARMVEYFRWNFQFTSVKARPFDKENIEMEVRKHFRQLIRDELAKESGYDKGDRKDQRV